jgi:hypothetical protein
MSKYSKSAETVGQVVGGCLVAFLPISLVVGALGGLSVLFSFPNSYALDVIVSQSRQCQFRLKNPAARTGMGALTLLGGVPTWVAIGALIYENVIPTAENYHDNGMPCTK